MNAHCTQCTPDIRCVFDLKSVQNNFTTNISVVCIKLAKTVRDTTNVTCSTND